MYDAAQTAIRIAKGKTRDALESDEMLSLSLVKCIEIVGEAANQITKERQNELAQIPWSEVVGMRHRLIHAYFQINFDIVWDTVTRNFPALIVELKKIGVDEEYDGSCN
jgi:uncharacterized protein with HEPN domain